MFPLFQSRALWMPGRRQTESGRSFRDAMLATPFWTQPLNLNEALLDVLTGLAVFKV